MYGHCAHHQQANTVNVVNNAHINLPLIVRYIEPSTPEQDHVTFADLIHLPPHTIVRFTHPGQGYFIFALGKQTGSRQEICYVPLSHGTVQAITILNKPQQHHGGKCEGRLDSEHLPWYVNPQWHIPNPNIQYKLLHARL